MGKVVDTIKIVGGGVISIGVGAVTQGLLDVVLPNETGKIMRTCMKVGGYATGGLAGFAASKQFGRKVDLVNDIIEKTMKDIKEDDVEKKEFDVKPEDVE